MAHRTQITLTEPQYQRLRREAERTGASLSELIRRAIDRTYGGDLTLEDKLRIVEETAGALGEDYGRRYDAYKQASWEARRRSLDDR